MNSSESGEASQPCSKRHIIIFLSEKDYLTVVIIIWHKLDGSDRGKANYFNRVKVIFITKVTFMMLKS